MPKSNTVLMCMQEHNPDGSNHCFQKLNQNLAVIRALLGVSSFELLQNAAANAAELLQQEKLRIFTNGLFGGNSVKALRGLIWNTNQRKNALYTKYNYYFFTLQK